MNGEAEPYDPALAETAAEVTRAIGVRLPEARRDLLYRRALQIVDDRMGRPSWRRWRTERWMPAALGGVLVAAAAGAAIGLAFAHGRRARQATAAA